MGEATHHRRMALGQALDRSPHDAMKVAVKRQVEIEEALEAERQLVKTRWERFVRSNEALDHSRVRSWASAEGSPVASDPAR